MNTPSAALTSEPESLGTPETDLRDRRAIVDRRALQGEIEAIVAADLADAERRQRVVAVLKNGFAAGVAEVRRRFEGGGPGSLAVRGQCHLVDQLVRVVHDHVIQHLYPLANPTDAQRLALVAVGG
jgi:[protein-PII] uridylyltransferase